MPKRRQSTRRPRLRPRGIIPPVILDHIVDNAPTAEARIKARRTIRVTEEAREKRTTEAVEPQEDEDRLIHDAENTERLPGKVVRVEDSPETPDRAVSRLYDETGNVYKFMRRVLMIKSYDNKGARMNVVAHYGDGIDNAFWDGQFYISCDGHYFIAFDRSPSICYHEWMHAFDGAYTNLEYSRQPGAIAEGGIADFLACAIRQWLADVGPEEAQSWWIAPELFGPAVGIQGYALRDPIGLAPCYDDPVIGTDELVHHMDGYYTGSADNYGVHSNSGIPFRALALAAQHRGGKTWETVVPALRDVIVRKRIGRRAGFQQFAEAVLKSTVDIFGPGDPLVQSVIHGWREVGITGLVAPPVPVRPSTAPVPPPSPGPTPAPPPQTDTVGGHVVPAPIAATPPVAPPPTAVPGADFTADDLTRIADALDVLQSIPAVRVWIAAKKRREAAAGGTP